MEPKTPILNDKRLFVSVGTVIALLVSRFLGVDLDPELLATIALIIVGWVGSSAAKEASVAKSNATASVKTDEDAAKALGGQ